MKKFLALILLLLCTAPAFSSGYPKDFNPHIIPNFHYPEYTGYDGTGQGRIWGKLVAQTQLFGLRVFPNTKVYLIPNTSFSGWYVDDVGYAGEHADDKTALVNYPPELQKYTRETTTDASGMYAFNNLPDGSYIVDAYLDVYETTRPDREGSSIGYDTNGDMIIGMQHYKGYKIRDDAMFVAASGTVNYAHDLGNDQITGFSIIGESTCCKHEI
jgi:hypothetical protein